MRAARLAPAAVVALLVMLSGCARTQPEQPIVLPDPPRLQAPAATAASREHERILAAYGGAYENERLRTLLAGTVGRLVAASERPDLRYRITVLNSPSVNAFALPSGELYVTRGLLALANDEAELASVLAHEMAHVIARHAAIREDQARRLAIVSTIVNEVLSDPETGALALAKSRIALSNFSRAQEFEADGIGIGIAARAGYDPYGAVRFLTSMGRNATLRAGAGQNSPVAELLSSHPATPDRIRHALLQARGHAAPGTGAQEREAYLAALDGLVFGEDPAEGFVRGRRFLHPRLGFTFTAPEDFVLENSPQALLGTRDDGAAALRVDVVQVPAEQSLADYLGSGWIENVARGSIASLEINGFPAATATAKGEQWAFRIYAIRFGSDVYRFIYAAKAMTPAIDRTFRQSVQSFRRLSLAEIEAVQPLRLKVVVVRPGETAETLARRMAVADRALERFRILNGLGPSEQPRPGQAVKLIVE